METLDRETKDGTVSEIANQRFTRIEAAQYLRVSVVSVDRAIAKRKISFFRLGRRIVFAKQHLDDFLNRNEVTAVIRGRRSLYAQ